MFHRIPSISKVDAAIGWQPTRTLDEILADVIRHIREAPIQLDEPEPVAG
jgi:hypothetical protein